MPMLKPLFIALLSATALVSCGPKELVVESQPIEKSFEVSQFEKSEDEVLDALKLAPLATNNFGQITIEKSTLGKNYILSPSIIINRDYTMLDHMAAKLVKFEKAGDKLALFEQRLNLYYNELETAGLVETFEIVKETDTQITFNWAYGLTYVSLTSAIAAGTDYPPTFPQTEAIVPVSKSAVRKLAIEDGALKIEQISQVQVQTLPGFSEILAGLLSGGTAFHGNHLYTIKYLFELKEYKANPNFTPKYNSFGDNIGYFENPVLSRPNVQPKFQAMRWDTTNGPIQVGLSKNIPAEFKEAVKEGVLYWNSFTEKPLVQVDVDVDPNEYPKDKRVLVHWAQWDSAGFARASLQADPLTGELIKANV